MSNTFEDFRRIPTGYCVCPVPDPAHWHRACDHDGEQKVTCMRCARHWRMRDGQVVDGGVAFVPRTDYLRRLQALQALGVEIDINKTVVVELDGSSHLIDTPVELPEDDKLMRSIRPPNRAGRFDWFEYEDLNPFADRLVGEYHHDPLQNRRERHQVYSWHYRQEYTRSRKASTLIAFADRDSMAMDADWFREALQELNDCGEAAVYKQIMARVAGEQSGARSDETLAAIIRRDVRMYERCLADCDASGQLRRGAIAAIATEFCVGKETVREVRREYKKLWPRVQKVAGLFPSERQMVAELRRSAERLQPFADTGEGIEAAVR